MPFVDKISDQRSRGLALSGIASVLVLTVLSLLSVNILTYHIGLSFLPLAGLYLWPRLANPMLSVLGLFALGCLADMLGETPLGFWPFVYLVYFMVFRPDTRETSSSLMELWLGFLVAVIVAALTMLVASFIFIGQPIKLTSLIFGWAPVLSLFPLVYLGLRAIGRRSTDGSGAGFVT
ncbi:hypothetical protein [Fretibacter rubidus]|uniref:hypothetical protein n=1 Tax=Fretibacter rubidus TaxID=570162 RepID=UPI00352A6BA3